MEQRDIEIFLILAEERTAAETSRIRAFHQIVRDLVAARANPLLDPEWIAARSRRPQGNQGTSA